jgi:hypothetical protein
MTAAVIMTGSTARRLYDLTGSVSDTDLEEISARPEIASVWQQVAKQRDCA